MKLPFVLVLLSLVSFSWLSAADVSYNQSRINSKWGAIELVLPKEIPPDTFWNPFVKAEPIKVNEDTGKLVWKDYTLYIGLRMPHIYGIKKYNSESCWKYERGVPVKCSPKDLAELIW